MIQIGCIKNPYGKDWLEKLKHLLPTIEGLNVSNERLLIDGNRLALFVKGHKTKKSKAFIGMTKISKEGNDLKISTTALNYYLIFGFWGPLVFILIIWLNSQSIPANILTSLFFLYSPIYYVRDIIKQNKFSLEIKSELERLNGK